MSENTPSVLVMMATYNGEKYIREQIDSILAQEGVDVSLRICDDRSSDGTADVCREYQRLNPNVRFSVNKKNLGIGMNFMQMVYEANSREYDFYAFADQDDVWLPQKLAVAAEAIEKRKGEDSARCIGDLGVPILYCSDLCDVDATLKNEVRELTKFKPNLDKRATPLIRNLYSGCTMVFNAPFLRLLQRNRYETMGRIHDAFVAALAIYCANFVLDLENALILRRLTGFNNGGPLDAGGDLRKASLSRVVAKPSDMYQEMAQRLYDDYGDCMTAEDRALVASFLKYRQTPLRAKWVFSNDYFAVSHRDNLLVRTKFLLGRY